MTRDEFMAQAVASGKPKEEIKRVFDSIEASGEFDNVPHETPATQEPEEATFIERAGRRVGEFPERFSKAKETSGGGFLWPVNAAVGETVRTIGDVAGEAGKSAAAILPKPAREFLGRQVGGVVNSAVETPGIKQAIGAYQKLPESTRYNLGTSAGVAGLAPMVGPALKATGEAVKLGKEIKTGMGESLLASGKKTLQSGMKPKDVTAKMAGRNVDEGARNIMNQVAKYDLESPIGGFNGIAIKAKKRIDAESDAAESKLAEFSKNNPGATHDMDESFINLIDDIEGGKVNSVFGEEEAAAKYVSDIHKALNLRGLSGQQAIGKLPEIKNVISNYAGGLFKKGSHNIQKDPLKQQVGELSYLKIKNNLEKYVPEIAENNKAIHELITVKQAANEAVKRIGNRNKIGLEDWALLLGGPGVVHTLGAENLSGLAGIPGAVLIGKKALSGGRGASAMMKLGKVIKGDKKLLGNRPGAVPMLGATAALSGGALLGGLALERKRRNRK